MNPTDGVTSRPSRTQPPGGDDDSSGQRRAVPLVVQEASLDRDETVHRATLYDLQAKYAEVVSLQFALDYLGAVSG